MSDLQSCTICNQEKPEGDFYGSDAKTGRYRCKACIRIKRQQSTSNPKSYLKRACQQLRSTRVKQGFTWEITHQDLWDLWESQRGKCALSGVLLTWHRVNGDEHPHFNASIDRKNNNEGYTRENLQLVAYRANVMRHNLQPDTWSWWIRTINEHMEQQHNG